MLNQIMYTRSAVTSSQQLPIQFVIGRHVHVVLISAVKSSPAVTARVHKGVREVERLYVVLSVVLLLKLLATELAGEAERPALSVLFQKGLVLGNTAIIHTWEQRTAENQTR